jgi:hypothetical protein
MTDADTVTNDELAILSDFVAGWSLKRVENSQAMKTEKTNGKFTPPAVLHNRGNDLQWTRR